MDELAFDRAAEAAYKLKADARRLGDNASHWINTSTAGLVLEILLISAALVAIVFSIPVGTVTGGW